MTSWGWSLAIWLSWAALFLILELWAVTRWPFEPPWNSLSWTAWQIQARWPITGLAFAGGLFVLLLHIVLPGHWPRRGNKYPKIDEQEGDR